MSVVCLMECDRESSIMGGPWPNRGLCDMPKNLHTGNVRRNGTLRRVLVTIVVVEKQSVLHILSVRLQP